MYISSEPMEHWHTSESYILILYAPHVLRVIGVYSIRSNSLLYGSNGDSREKCSGENEVLANKEHVLTNKCD